MALSLVLRRAGGRLARARGRGMAGAAAGGPGWAGPGPSGGGGEARSRYFLRAEGRGVRSTSIFETGQAASTDLPKALGGRDSDPQPVRTARSPTPPPIPHPPTRALSHRRPGLSAPAPGS